MDEVWRKTFIKNEMIKKHGETEISIFYSPEEATEAHRSVGEEGHEHGYEMGGTKVKVNEGYAVVVLQLSILTHRLRNHFFTCYARLCFAHRSWESGFQPRRMDPTSSLRTLHSRELN